MKKRFILRIAAFTLMFLGLALILSFKSAEAYNILSCSVISGGSPCSTTNAPVGSCQLTGGEGCNGATFFGQFPVSFPGSANQVTEYRCSSITYQGTYNGNDCSVVCQQDGAAGETEYSSNIPGDICYVGGGSQSGGLPSTDPSSTPAIDSACGPSNGGYFPSAPTNDASLCDNTTSPASHVSTPVSEVTTNSFSPNGEWEWACDNGSGNPMSCSAFNSTPDINISLSPATLSISQGQTASYTITITPLYFNTAAPLTLTYAGALPGNSTYTITPSSFTAGQVGSAYASGGNLTATLTIVTTAITPVTSYSQSVQGYASSMPNPKDSLPVNLTVTAPPPPPPAPTTASASCSVGSSVANWTNMGASDVYNLAGYDTTKYPVYPGTCDNANGLLCLSNVPGTSVTLPPSMSVPGDTYKVWVQTKDTNTGLTSAGVTEVNFSTGGTYSCAALPPVCPAGSVQLSAGSVTNGGTATASAAPAGFSGGVFNSSNTAIASVSGFTINANSLGNTTISGSGWNNVNGATGCSLVPAAITVTGNCTPNATSTCQGVGASALLCGGIETCNSAGNWGACNYASAVGGSNGNSCTPPGPSCYQAGSGVCSSGACGGGTPSSASICQGSSCVVNTTASCAPACSGSGTCPGASLSVTLTPNPPSGPAGFTPALTANVVSTDNTDSLNYSFWWDCSSTNTTVGMATTNCGNPSISAKGAKFSGVFAASEIATPPATAYATPAQTYHPLVIVEQTNFTPAIGTAIVTTTGSCTPNTTSTVGCSGTNVSCGGFKTCDNSGNWGACSFASTNNNSCDPGSSCVQTGTGVCSSGDCTGGNAIPGTHLGCQGASCVSLPNSTSTCADDCSACGGTTNTVNLTTSPSSPDTTTPVTLTATVGGTDPAPTVNYSFWWNCSNPTTIFATANNDPSCGSLVTPTSSNTCAINANGEKCDGIPATTQTAVHTYATAGSYTPKVIIERGAAPSAQDQSSLTITNSGGGNHFECVNNACTSVAGAGPDRCNIANGNADCGNGAPGNGPVHGVCDAVHSACVNAAGAGASTCSSDPACSGGSTVSHLACENNACVIVGGAGANQCAAIGSGSCSGSGTVSLVVLPSQTVPVGTPVTVTASGGTGVYTGGSPAGWTDPGITGGSVSGPGGDTLTGTYSSPGSYSVGVTDSGGSSANTIITVVAPTCTFTANPPQVQPGVKSILSWTCFNTVSCSISGVGAVNQNGGSVQVTPASTATYTLTCSGAGSGPANVFNGSATVTVAGSRPIETNP